jgi:hypothetical protein
MVISTNGDGAVSDILPPENQQAEGVVVDLSNETTKMADRHINQPKCCKLLGLLERDNGVTTVTAANHARERKSGTTTNPIHASTLKRNQ